MLFHLEESECNGLPTTTPRIHAGACYTLFLNGSSLCHMHLLTRLLLLYYIRLHFSSRHLDPPRPKPHPTPPHSTLLLPHLTPPHPIPFHSTPLHSSPLQPTPLRFTSLHFTPIHFASFVGSLAMPECWSTQRQLFGTSHWERHAGERLCCR